MAAYGFNQVVPARGGDIIKLFLTRSSIPNSSYPAVGSSFFVEAIFDLCMAIPILAFAFTQGAFPKPPDFSQLRGLRPRLLREQPAVHAVPADLPRHPRDGGLRAPERPRAGVLGTRAPGRRDPQGPAALLPRGLPRPARRLGAALHRLLVPARRVQRRRLGRERPARAGRQRGRRARAVHARRRRRPAGAARQGVLRHRRGSDRRGLFRRPADRDRRRLVRRRLRRHRLHLPLPLLQGGHRGGPRGPGRRRPKKVPGAPRAPASRPRGRPSPSPRGSAAPAARWCPGY